MRQRHFYVHTELPHKEEFGTYFRYFYRRNNRRTDGKSNC